MRRDSLSLLEGVQRLLERTYRMSATVTDIGRFVIGDEGYRRLYGNATELTSVPASAGQGAKTLVRQTADGVRICVYYPDALIRCLEAHPPQRGLRDSNVDAFATLVEELDHLLCIGERVAVGLPLSLFELELHANVSKHLVLTRFVAGERPRVGARRAAWLRYHLYEKSVCRERDPEVAARYRDARRWAVRLMEALRREQPSSRIRRLRQFHRAGAAGKLELIESLAA